MRGRRRLLIVGLLVAVLAWVFSHSKRLPEEPATPEARDTTREETRVVRLYFASPGGDSLEGEARELASKPGLHERVDGLVKELARGPRGGGVALVPPGTALRHVYLDRRGMMTVDLTPAFRERFRGGSTAEILAVASLVHTLLENTPEARRVRFVCAGEPLATLGGHVACDEPFDLTVLP